MPTCAQITRRVQNEHIELAQAKADRSPVTIADFAVQAVIARELQNNFPEDGLVAEESGGFFQSSDNILPAVVAQVQQIAPETTTQQVIEWIDYGHNTKARRFWVLDPVDGTKGFLRRMQYVTALALVVNHEVVLSVIGCPQLDLFSDQSGFAFAAKDHGAYWQPYDRRIPPTKLTVSNVDKLSLATLLRSFEDSHTNQGTIERFVSIANIKTDPIQMDSQAKYVLLAAGKADILLRLPPDDRPDFHENIWDQAPAYCLVREAGGEMTDREGNSLDFSTGITLKNNSGIIATNQSLHAQTLDILAQLSH